MYKSTANRKNEPKEYNDILQFNITDRKYVNCTKKVNYSTIPRKTMLVDKLLLYLLHKSAV